VALAGTAACLVLASVIAQQAAESESKIVKAAKIAMSITSAGDYANPKWKPHKQEMLTLIHQGIAINPHYRKITPIVADELARWGDWANAIPIWESVLSSRPYVVAIMANVARGYASTGHNDQAFAYLERARKLQPEAPAVRSLEVVLLSRTGEEAKALALAKDAIAARAYDFDLLNAAFFLAVRSGDYPVALDVMKLRIEEFPWSRARSYIQLGTLYANGIKDPERAMEAFRRGLAAAKPSERQEFMEQIPPAYWRQLGYIPSLPPNGTQTSASKR
jgi:tetratricopeptide (TPR) repeat protein